MNPSKTKAENSERDVDEANGDCAARKLGRKGMDDLYENIANK